MREEGEGRAQHETQREYLPAEVEFLFRDRLYVVRAIHVLVLQGVHASPSRKGGGLRPALTTVSVVRERGCRISERGGHMCVDAVIHSVIAQNNGCVIFI